MSSFSRNARLSGMMFLNYVVWGAWYVTIGTYLTATLKFSGTETGAVFGTTALASMISPFFVGLIADRFFATEKILAALHVIGAVFLFLMTRATSFGAVYAIMLAYCICFFPTIALTNSLALKQIEDAGKQFPLIRVFATFGWIFIGQIVGYLGIEAKSTQFELAAGASILMALYSLTLPHTPPAGSGQPMTVRNLLGLDALVMLKRRTYLVFIIASILACIPLTFYFSFTNAYFNDVGVQNAAGKMTLGQVSEVAAMLLMPFIFRRVTVRAILLIGLLSWSLRYGLLAFGNAGAGVWMFYVAILLHGVCFDFFFMTGQLYADQEAPPELRVTAQGFLTFVTYGIGMFAGSLLSGVAVDFFSTTHGATVTRNWSGFWLSSGGRCLRHPAAGSPAVPQQRANPKQGRGGRRQGVAGRFCTTLYPCVSFWPCSPPVSWHRRRFPRATPAISIPPIPIRTSRPRRTRLWRSGRRGRRSCGSRFSRRRGFCRCFPRTICTRRSSGASRTGTTPSRRSCLKPFPATISAAISTGRSKPAPPGGFPAVASPHGHWNYGRLEHTDIASVPARCINLARQGYVVFAYDMVGYDDTIQTPHDFGDKPAEELWDFGPLQLQLWNSIRVVDFLESLPGVNRGRIGVTGASGGATQTMMLQAVDDRIQFSAPANMVSFLMQGGSLCENAPGLRLDTNNVEIASMMAPKPMIMSAATGDWTKNMEREEYPAVRAIYDLYGKDGNVAYFYQDAPHNYNRPNREATYAFFGKHVLGVDDPSKFKEKSVRIEKLGDMLALFNRKLPDNAISFSQLFDEWVRFAKEQTGDERERLTYALAAEWPSRVISDVQGERVLLSRPGRRRPRARHLGEGREPARAGGRAGRRGGRPEVARGPAPASSRALGPADRRVSDRERRGAAQPLGADVPHLQQIRRRQPRAGHPDGSGLAEDPRDAPGGSRKGRDLVHVCRRRGP